MSTEIDAEGFKRFEQDSYSSVAEKYASKAAYVSAQTNEAILDAAGVVVGTRLIDIACGPGFLSAAGVERGASVVGVDFAPNMVGVARKRYPEAEFREADAEDLPFEAESFDAAVCSLGLLHFPDPERAVSEAYRVIKPGGRYVFTSWTPPAENPFMRLILGSIQAHGNLDVDLPVGPPLFRFGDPAECNKVLTDAGFHETSVSPCPIAWASETAEQFLEEILSSTGRLAPMLALQTDEDRKKIEQAIIDGAKSYRVSEGIRIPFTLLVVSGRKP